MNAVQKLKYKLDMEAYLKAEVFHGPVIQKRREERIRWAPGAVLRSEEYAKAEKMGYERGLTDASKRERKLAERYEREAAGVLAGVMTVWTAVTVLVSIAMML